MSVCLKNATCHNVNKRADTCYDICKFATYCKYGIYQRGDVCGKVHFLYKLNRLPKKEPHIDVLE